MKAKRTHRQIAVFNMEVFHSAHPHLGEMSEFQSLIFGRVVAAPERDQLSDFFIVGFISEIASSMS
jgi:hypothetical protein